MRKLQRYTVNIPRRLFAQLQQQAAVAEIYPGIYAQAMDGLYHPKYGLGGGEDRLLNIVDLIL